MRVAQINSFFSDGGTARIVNGIYDELLANGNECHIFASRGKIPHPNASSRIGNIPTILFNASISRIFDNEGFNAHFTTLNLIKKIKDFNPDIIHIHNLHGYYLNINILFDFLKSYQRPVVWTLHDCWALTGHCAWFTSAGCYKWSCAQGCTDNCSQLKEYPSCWFYGRVSKNFNLKKHIFTGVKNLTITIPSQWLAECVNKSFLKNYNINVIPNGVNTFTFRPVENHIKKHLGIEDKTLLLGVATPWIKRKGFFDFIKIAAELDDSYVIMLIGITEKQKKMLPHNITAIPKISDARKLAEYYTAADLFLNLSDEETFGLVTVEALACGTPVLVKDSTACSEPVDNTCGIIIETTNQTKDIIKIINEGMWRNFNAQTCRSHALKFTATEQYSKYLKLYNSII